MNQIAMESIGVNCKAVMPLVADDARSLRPLPVLSRRSAQSISTAHQSLKTHSREHGPRPASRKTAP